MFNVCAQFPMPPSGFFFNINNNTLRPFQSRALSVPPQPSHAQRHPMPGAAGRDTPARAPRPVSVVDGGDIRGALTNHEIDALHRLVAARGLPCIQADLIYRFRTNVAPLAYTHKALDDALRDVQWIAVPFHVRWHWVLALVRRGTTTRYDAVIFDSAPSPAARADIRKIATKLGASAEFLSPFRQGRDTLECGLFCVMHAALAAHDADHLIEYARRAAPSTVDLSTWRDFLSSRRSALGDDDLTRLLSLAHLPADLWTPPRASTSGGARWRHDPYAAAPATASGGSILAPRAAPPLPRTTDAPPSSSTGHTRAAIAPAVPPTATPNSALGDVGPVTTSATEATLGPAAEPAVSAAATSPAVATTATSSRDAARQRRLSARREGRARRRLADAVASAADSAVLRQAEHGIPTINTPLEGGGRQLTPDWVLANALTAVNRAALGEHRLNIVSPRACWCAVNGLLPIGGLVADDRVTLFPAFDGPVDEGHWFGVYYFPGERSLLVVDTVAHVGHRQAVEFLVSALSPRRITYQRIHSSGPDGCAADVVAEVARAVRVRHPPLDASVLATWRRDGNVPLSIFRADGSIPCRWCGGPCDGCNRAPTDSRMPLARAPMMALTAQILSEMLPPVEQAQDDLLGGTLDDDARIADAPALGAVAVRAAFDSYVRERGLTSKDDLVGRGVQVTFRSVHGGRLIRRVWYGVVKAVRGTTRATSYEIEYVADAFGPLFNDDRTRVVTEKGLLPPRSDDAIQVLHVAVLDAAPHEPCADSSDDDEAPRAVHGAPAPSDEFVDPYPPIQETDADVDAALWAADPATSAASPDAWLTGRRFIDFTLCSFDDAKRKTPSTPWAAVTESVRAGHVESLHRLRAFIAASRHLVHLPLDVLLCLHLQQLRTRRSWAWTTVSRNAAELIGALCALPMYALNGPSINPSRFTHFKALLQAASRLGVAAGPRQPVAATTDDIRVAAAHLTDPRAKALLLIVWFSAMRPGDALQLRREDVTFPQGCELRLRVARSKTVNHVGCYHIHTSVNDAASLETIRRYVASVPDGFLFKLRSGYQRQHLLTEVRMALRRSRPVLELRSLRRGTLQALAQGGASIPELLQFSRHTTVDQLIRYLGDGAVPHADQRAGIARAAVLAEGLTGGAPRESAAPMVQLEDWISVSADGEAYLPQHRAPPLPDSIIDRTGYALHAKPATARGVDLNEVDRMADEAPAPIRDAWCTARKFLTNDDDRYTSVPWDGKLHEADLRPGDITKLLAINNVVEVDPSELHRVAGSIRVFLHPEDAKKRFRLIKWTYDYNRFYGRATLIPTPNATKISARPAILSSQGAVVIDLQAEFDQLCVTEEVSWCQCFKHNGRVYRNKKLSMGLRHATTVGTSFLRVLLAFDHPGVTVDFATDAARFAGPRDAVIKAAWEFVQRCRRVGAVANEIDVNTATIDGVARLYSEDAVDFVGEVASMRDKTIRCRDRHVEKLRAYYLRSCAHGATYRDLFGLYGMVTYMSATLGIKLYDHYPTRAFYSGLARRLALDPSLWQRPAPSRPPEKDLKSWVTAAIANKPARIFAAPVPDTVVIGDACRIGYAGIVVHRAFDGALHTALLQHRWERRPVGTLDFSASTVSEPEAAARLLDEAVQLFPGSTPLYLTDHEPFIAAFDRGYSISSGYNSRVRRIKERHPRATMRFCAGRSMLADPYSRYVVNTLSASDREAAIAVATAILDGRSGGQSKVEIWVEGGTTAN